MSDEPSSPDALGLGLDAPRPAAPGDSAPAAAYRVLARKYRPMRFEDLIGQGAMVKTLGNAFATGRIHQAYIFTGVRGVGKTTTARILARALNYETDDAHAPSIAMPALGRHCAAIMESRHVDVIEMDAASNTSINDVREIIEGARYKPVSARTKVYIIDEVHMLSTAAFNGLLKTLEEPPPHVKFLFATTEIRKVPVTVLSRCQRFDLRRIEAGEIVAHLAGIAEQERVQAEHEALALIARASEGSMRDALSLLDQAIAHGEGRVLAEEVRASLGLADRSRVIDLFEMLMRGECGAALAEFSSQYEAGAEPSGIVADLADLVHLVTRLKLVPAAANDPALSPAERERGTLAAKALPMRILTRAWQILLRGLGEVQTSNRPRAAAEMLLVRLAYAADLPTPDEALRLLRDGEGQGEAPRGGGPGSSSGSFSGGTRAANAGMALVAGSLPAARSEDAGPAPAVTARAGPKVALAGLPDLVALAEAQRDIALKVALERNVRLVAFERGRIEFQPAPGAAADLSQRLSRALAQWTGERWLVAVSNRQGAPTLHEAAQAERTARENAILDRPDVKAALAALPGAKVVEVRPAGRSAPNGSAGSAAPASPAAPEPVDFLADAPEDDEPDALFEPEPDFTDDDL